MPEPLPRCQVIPQRTLIKDISREISGIIKGDDYVVLDVAGEYQLNKQWRLFAGAELMKL